MTDSNLNSDRQKYDKNKTSAYRHRSAPFVSNPPTYSNNWFPYTSSQDSENNTSNWVRKLLQLASLATPSFRQESFKDVRLSSFYKKTRIVRLSSFVRNFVYSLLKSKSLNNYINDKPYKFFTFIIYIS